MHKNQGIQPPTIAVQTKTSKNHQTVIPAEVRKLWGYEGELILTWYYNPASQEVSVKATPTSADEWVRATKGTFATGRTKEEIDRDLDEMRAEWD